jgi:hypothetical protein
MIDRAARLRIVGNLERALAGTITNWEFDDSWPNSEDRVIRALEEQLWGFYDDNNKLTLNIREQKPDAVPLFERCIAFLRSDREYKWPNYSFRKTGMSYFRSLFDRAGEAKRWKEFEASGDIEAWPFFRSSDTG